MPDKRGRFKKGEHWRKPKKFWQREWLIEEYVNGNRSAADIAAEFGVGDTAVLYWLKKHGIETRTMSKIRQIKHWGASGERNPMYGKRGILNPNWKGGHTPYRQEIYSRLEWTRFVSAIRKRDRTCRLCDGTHRLEIHHIEPFSQAPLLVMDIGNAILLCHDCHVKLQGKEKRWRNKLFRIIGEQLRNKTR